MSNYFWCVDGPEHAFEATGERYIAWTSNGFSEAPPPDAPQYVKGRCLKCGRTDLLEMVPAERAAPSDTGSRE